MQIWVRQEYRAFQKSDIGFLMPSPYSISMALHEIMDLLAEERGAVTITTITQTEKGEVSAARYGFKPVGAAKKLQIEVGGRKSFNTRRAEYLKEIHKRGNKGPKTKVQEVEDETPAAEAPESEEEEGEEEEGEGEEGEGEDEEEYKASTGK